MHARRLSLALAREHLSAGYDVVVGQYLTQTTFIEELEHLAARFDALFLEFVLELDARALAVRLAGRSAAPDRPDHIVNNRLVGPDDAGRLVESLRGLREARPRTIWVDARGRFSATLDRLRAALD